MSERWRAKYNEERAPLMVLRRRSGRQGGIHNGHFFLMNKVPETLSERILEKVKAPDKAGDVPFISPEQLQDADGFLFGFPSRFGVMAAQFKAFFDATGHLWETQKLAGKPAGIFWSTGFHGGGQELTALTAITQLSHHGMLFVPLGYTFGKGMFEINEVKGGSCYGAGTYAGDGSRKPTELELQQAFFQGQYLAGVAKKIKDSERHGRGSNCI